MYKVPIKKLSKITIKKISTATVTKSNHKQNHRDLQTQSLATGKQHKCRGTQTTNPRSHQRRHLQIGSVSPPQNNLHQTSIIFNLRSVETTNKGAGTHPETGKIKTVLINSQSIYIADKIEEQRTGRVVGDRQIQTGCRHTQKSKQSI